MSKDSTMEVSQTTSSTNLTSIPTASQPDKSSTTTTPTTPPKPIPPTFDLGNLLCHDPSPLPPSPPPTLLANTARLCAQSLITQLLTTCPITTSSTTSSLSMTLPPPTYPLPREKPLPSPKAATKWEKFALKKGIKDKKRGEGKKEYDAEKGEWVPKWGYKGRNKAGEGEWIVEVEDGGRKEGEMEREGVGRTVRGEGRRGRVEKVRRNERRQRANERKGRKGGGGGGG